jgi:hypothetical protein
MSAAETILKMVETVVADESRFGAFLTGEKLAIALVLDRKDLLDSLHGSYTMLEAVDGLGDDWLRAAIAVQQSRR